MEKLTTAQRTRSTRQSNLYVMHMYVEEPGDDSSVLGRQGQRSEEVIAGAGL